MCKILKSQLSRTFEGLYITLGTGTILTKKISTNVEGKEGGVWGGEVARGISVTCDWAFFKSVICEKAENKSVTCDRGIVCDL